MSEQQGIFELQKLTVLEIVAEFPDSEVFFRRWDNRAGECIMCRALFESVESLCRRYGLDLREFLAGLEKAIGCVENGERDDEA